MTNNETAVSKKKDQNHRKRQATKPQQMAETADEKGDAVDGTGELGFRGHWKNVVAQVLRESEGWKTVREVAAETPHAPEQLSSAMQSLRKQDLVAARWTVRDQPKHEYQLTERGRERIEELK